MVRAEVSSLQAKYRSEYEARTHTIRETIERFNLDVTFFHRQLTREELAESRAQSPSE